MRMDCNLSRKASPIILIRLPGPETHSRTQFPSRISTSFCIGFWTAIRWRITVFQQADKNAVFWLANGQGDQKQF
jgi:hypothetical protein